MNAKTLLEKHVDERSPVAEEYGVLLKATIASQSSGTLSEFQLLHLAEQNVGHMTVGIEEEEEAEEENADSSLP